MLRRSYRFDIGFYFLLALLSIGGGANRAPAACGDCSIGSPITFQKFDLIGVTNGTICRGQTVTIDVRTRDTDRCTSGCSTTDRNDNTDVHVIIKNPANTVILDVTENNDTPGENWLYSFVAQDFGTYTIQVTSDDTCDWANDAPVTQTKTFLSRACCADYSPCCSENPCLTSPDCNGNGINDHCEIQCGLVPDCNDNLIPDGCDIDPSDPDHDGNVSQDCNNNHIPDECDLANGILHDCDGNGVPDECSACPPVHIVFVMDTSGSMDDEGDALCQNISLVIQQLQTLHINATTELMAITWPRWCLSETLTVADLSTIVPDDPPECCLYLCNEEDWGPATAIVSAFYPWPQGKLRLIVPISDEGPHCGSPCCADGYYSCGVDQEECENPFADAIASIQHAIHVATDNNVIVSPIAAKLGPWYVCEEDCVWDMAQLLANGTGGTAIQSTNATELPLAIQQIVLHACSQFADCNFNGTPDPCDTPDCNHNFSPDDCEIAQNPGLDANGNHILDVCEIVPTPLIRIYNQLGDDITLFDTNGNPYVDVGECAVLRLDGSDSDPGIPGGMTFAWDLDGQGFNPPDALGPEVLYTNVSNGAAPAVFLVKLRVTNDMGNSAEKTARLTFADLHPQASLTGPAQAAAGDLVYLNGAAYSHCDSLTNVQWDFQYVNNTFTIDASGTPPSALTISHIWPNIGTYVVAIRVFDADDTQSTATVKTHQITITAANPPYSGLSADLIAESRYHVDDTQAQAGDPPIPANHIRHRAQLRVVNQGDSSAPGPLFVAFANLTPTGTQLVNAAPPGGPLGSLGLPYIELIPSGITLETNDSSDWVWVKWDIPSNATTDFGFAATVYLQQRPPQFSSNPVTSATEGLAYEYHAHADDPEQLPVYYELAASPTPPAGMSINAVTGILSWTPSQTAANPPQNPYSIKIIARDSYAGLFDDQPFIITVQAVNVAPEIHSIPETVTVATSPYEYTIVATDADGPLVFPNNYSLFAPPSGVALHQASPTAPIKLTWPQPVVGTHNIDLHVNDGELEDRQRYQLQVVGCLPTDRPRILHNAQTETASEALPYVKQILLDFQPPGQDVYYFLEVAPPGMVIGSTGLIQWLPSYSDHGPRVVRVRAQTGGDCKDTYSFTVQVQDRNGPPQITTTTLGSATEGVQLVRFITATDPDPDSPITFSLIEKPAGMVINPTTGQILWTPSQTAAAASPYTVKVRASDPSNAFDEKTYSLSVAAVNIPPQLTSLPITVVTEGERYEYQVRATDVDHPEDPNGLLLSYTLTTHPEGMNINVGGQGKIVWDTPLGSAEHSPYLVRVAVSDGVNTIFQPFELNVYPRPPLPNNPPHIELPYPPSFAVVGQNPAYIHDIVVTDPDVDDPTRNDVLHFSLQDQPASMSIAPVAGNPHRGRITMAPTVADLDNGQPKVYYVRVTVEDERNGWETLTYGLVIYPAGSGNQPPEIISQPIFVAQINQQYEYVVEATDPDNATLAFNLVPAPANGPDGGPLVAPPAGMTIAPHPTDGHKAIIHWTPTIQQVGTQWIKVVAQDIPQHEPSYQMYTLTASVVGNNRPPHIVSTPPQSAEVGNEYYYNVEIEDPDPADSHVFTLLTKPAGATIDDNTGEIRWTPTNDQIGIRSFRVQVTDAGEAWEQQYWDVAVVPEGDDCPNVPPQITSHPEQLVLAGTQWTYNVVFTDANLTNPLAPPCNETLTLTLEQKPNGMDFDPNNHNRIVWNTNDPADIGTHPVIVRVTDARGAWFQQQFSLYVSNALGNHGPQITTTPPALAQIGVEYVYEVAATDEDTPLDALTFSLEAKPSGATIQQTAGTRNATVRWTPTANQAGPNTFSVRVTDEHGAWYQQNFTLTASANGQNHPPTITSEPIFVVARSSSYSYDVDATDSDAGDTLTYSLDVAPAGMTINALTGVIQWQSPATDSTHPVTVRVTDNQQAWATQSYYVTVSQLGDDRAPRITSTPPQLVQRGQVYTYQIQAIDEDHDVLTWSLPVHPSVGNPIITRDPNDSAKATITWNTAGITVDTYPFRIRVEDGRGGWAEQWFNVTVWEGAPNHAPTIVSVPPSRVAEGSVYQYIAEANDADGDQLDWALVAPVPPGTPPPALVEDPGNSHRATLTWNTLGLPPARYDFHIRAQDGEGGWAEQNFSVDIGENLPPVITSVAPNRAVVDVQYRYEVVAHDPDEANLIYTFATGYTPPGNMHFDTQAANVLLWTPTAAEQLIGQFDVPLVVRDHATPPKQATQTAHIRVYTQQQGDFFPPVVSIALNRTQVNLNPPTTDDQVIATITATDDIGIQNNRVWVEIKNATGTILTSAWVNLTNHQGALPAFTPPMPGGYRVLATATDISGKVTTETADFLAVNSSTTDFNDPIVHITDPDNRPYDPEIDPQTPQVQGIVHVQGRVVETNLYKYELAYRSIGDTGLFHVFHTGYQQVGSVNSSGFLGDFDTTLLENGTYDLQLIAYDLSGNIASDLVSVVVTGHAKVGNFRMTYPDLEIPIMGIPITVSRTYDSRIKTKGDFGIGWQLELANLKLQESFPIEQGWEAVPAGIQCGIAQPVSHTISLIWPDGHTEVFSVVPHYQMQGVGGCFTVVLDAYNPLGFEPASPTTSTLGLIGDGPESVLNFENGGWMVVGNDFEDPQIWQSQGYVVTAIDGSVYEFGRRNPITGVSELTKVTDHNGNTLTFTENGIIHSAGLSVLFQRDSQGRIRRVVDPEQHFIEYEYDGDGNLAAVTDRTHNTTRFNYDSDHGLIEIIDPRGISVGRNVFDDNGRLITIIDADGNRTEFCRPTRPNPPSGCFTPSSPNFPSTVGNCSNYESVLDPTGVSTLHCYDSHGNVTATVKATAAGVVLSAETKQYDELDRESVITDAIGRSTTQTYEGNTSLVIRRVISEQGSPDKVSLFAFNQLNQITSATDPLGNTVHTEYDTRGNVTRIIFPDQDNTTENTYDSQGRMETTTDPEGHTTSFTYDEAGRALTRTDHLGNEINVSYDDNGNRLSETRTRTLPGGGVEQLTSTFEHDLAGRVIRQVNPLGEATSTTYNAIGKPETITDARGNVVRTEYDVRGNVSRIIYPDSTTEEFTYDAGGRQTNFKNRDGRISRTVYDDAGHQARAYIVTTNPGDWSTVPFVETEYDAVGRRTFVYAARTEGQTRRVIEENRYEPNRLITRQYIGGLSGTVQETITYLDAAGRSTQTTDARDNSIFYAYNDNGQLIRTTYPATSDHGSSMSRIERDLTGRKIAEINPAGKRTEFQYNEVGRLIKITNAEDEETSYVYNELGNPVRLIDAEGHATQMEYDALSRLTKRILPAGQSETFVYDANGNQISHTDYNGDTTRYIYDADNRLKLKTLPNKSIQAPVSGGQLSYHLSTDRTQLTLQCTHNITAPVAANIRLSNNPQGPVVFALGTGTSPIQTSVTLNVQNLANLEAGQLYFVILAGQPATPQITVQLNVPPAEEVLYDYTPAGLLTRSGGDTYDYNDRGLLEWEHKANGDTLRYEYTLTGNVKLVEAKRAGETSPTSTTRYEYDDLNRLWRVYDVTGSGETLVCEYGYDPIGNRARVTYTANNTEALYTYDEINRFKSVVNRKLGSGQIISSYTYTLGRAGNRLSVVENTGRRVDYTYDDVYRLLSETVTSDPDNHDFSTVYVYDGVGNRRHSTTLLPNGTVLTDYEYDPNDRLDLEIRTEMLTAAPPLDNATRYAMGMSRPSAASGYILATFLGLTSTTLLIPLALLWRRRDVGRRARRRSIYAKTICLFFVPMMFVGPDAVVAQYNDMMMYKNLSAVVASLPAPVVTVYAYTYDNNGNTLSRSDNLDTDSFTYDFENRLIAADVNIASQSDSFNYTYDAGGMRIAKSDGNSTTHYLVDKNQPYQQVLVESTIQGTGSPSIVRYTYGDDLIRMQRPGATPQAPPVVRYYHYDGQMSVRQLTDSPASGPAAVTDQYAYDGFGNTTAQSGQTQNNYRYAGEQYDPGTGFYYLRARYMNPALGRFVNRDPYAGSMYDPPTLHKYTYAGNNPISFADPSGMDFVELLATIYVYLQNFATQALVLYIVYNKVFTIIFGILAILNLVLMMTDPEAFQFFIATSGGDPMSLIAADIQAIGNLGRELISLGRAAPAEARNVVNLFHRVGEARDFGRKAARLSEAAESGSLIFVGETASLRVKDAQRAYRQAVKNRLISFLKSRGSTAEEAVVKAEQFIKNKDVDHLIDLQVSGAISDPNARTNLGMLDSSVNRSVGAQLKAECQRLGLEPGDVIHEIRIIEDGGG